MGSLSPFADGLPENVIVSILCCMNCAERKLASNMCTTWRSAFIRKACMYQNAVTITSSSQFDKLSGLLQHVRHLRIKLPLELASHKQSVVIDSYRFGLLYHAVRFCRFLHSIQFRTEFVRVDTKSEGQSYHSNLDELYDSAKQNLSNVRRVYSKSIVPLTGRLLQFIQTCVNLEALELIIRRCESDQRVETILSSLGKRLRVLSIQYVSGPVSIPIPITLFTGLRDRGIQLHQIELNSDFAECTSSSFMTELSCLQLAYPGITVKLNVLIKKAELHLSTQKLCTLLTEMNRLLCSLKLTVDLSYFDNYFCNNQRRQLLESIAFEQLESFSTDLSTEYTGVEHSLMQGRTHNAFSSLKYLEVAYAYNWMQFVGNFRNLRSLIITRQSFSDAEIDYELDTLATCCSRLEELSLASAMLTFSDTHEQTTFKMLRKLTISAIWTNQGSSERSSRVGTRFRIVAPALQKLRLLIQLRGGFSEADLQRWCSAVCNCPCLCSVELFAPFPDGSFSVDRAGIPAAWWLSVSTLRRLHTVRIRGSPDAAFGQLSTSLFSAIERCQALRQLKFRLSSDSEYHYCAGASDLIECARHLPKLSIMLSLHNKLVEG